MPHLFITPEPPAPRPPCPQLPNRPSVRQEDSIEAPSSDRLRLLIPIGSSRQSPAAVRYALARQAEGAAVDVCLVHAHEPPGQWELLRDARLAGRMARQRIETALSRVAKPLVDRGIPYAAYLRAGSVVFAILDAAEELDCHRIVVPAPQAGWWRRLLSRDVVSTLCDRQRSIPVVPVSALGEPAGR